MQPVLVVSAAPGVAQPAALQVWESSGALCFEVRADGSVHIKTGSSIVADL
jgi:hypothetical protein